MLDIVPQEATVAEAPPISKSIVQRQESTALTELQDYCERDRSWFNRFSDEVLDFPPFHMVGAFSGITSGAVGTMSLVTQEALNGGMAGLLIATGALTGAYTSMLTSKIRTALKDKRAFRAAEPELKAFELELADWLKRDYDLTLSSPENYPALKYLAMNILGIGGRELDPTENWSFTTKSGAYFQARVVQREDGGLELHRPSVEDLSEDSLIPPIRKAVEG